jgi:CubicO group peptidase (beta-lactamase class C family)
VSETVTTSAGTVAAGWEPVRAAFEANLAAGREVGAAIAVYHQGRSVVSLAGGSFDEAGSRPYTDDTLQLVFSTTKGITALAVARCVERGLLDYDAPVVDCWPEFGAAGKERITVAQLLSHQAGLPVIDGALTLDEVFDWDHMAARLAAQAPIWEPGTAHGYHAVTFGWLAGELVRRVDPEGRTLGGFVADELTGPIGAEAWIGLPAALEDRVSPLVTSGPPPDPAVAEFMRQVLGPDTLQGRALFLGGAFTPGDGAWNSPRLHTAEIPAANGIATATALARLYAAAIGEVDGVRLLDQATIDRARTTVTPQDEPDQVLVFPTTFGMGFMTSGMFTPMLGPGSFGHAGAGGSLAFAHPESQVAFAYVMNRMDSTLNGDVRALTLVHAVKEALAG